MKAGALVKVEILTPGLSVYSYGILLDDEAHDLYDGREKYKKIWVRIGETKYFNGYLCSLRSQYVSSSYC